MKLDPRETVQLGGCLLLAILATAGLMWLDLWSFYRPEERILDAGALAGVERVAIVSFVASDSFHYGAPAPALPDPETEENRSNPEAAQAVAALQLELWHRFAKALPFELLAQETVVGHPAYRRLARAAGTRQLRVSADPRLADFTPRDREALAELAGELGCDAVLTAHHSYSIEIEEGLEAKPAWGIFIESRVDLVGHDGEVLWSSHKLRGRSEPVQAESGLNLLLLRFSSVDREALPKMFVEAIEDQFTQLAMSLRQDLRTARESESPP